MKILIVENNPLIADAVERAGAELQMNVDRASDGWDAIEKLETDEYAAIVIDADVPHHSGFGVLTYLREEVGGELGHVVVMTSCEISEVRRKVQDDAVNVISCSDEMSELTDAVKRACERNRVVLA